MQCARTVVPAALMVIVDKEAARLRRKRRGTTVLRASMRAGGPTERTTVTSRSTRAIQSTTASHAVDDERDGQPEICAAAVRITRATIAAWWRRTPGDRRSELDAVSAPSDYMHCKGRSYLLALTRTAAEA